MRHSPRSLLIPALSLAACPGPTPPGPDLSAPGIWAACEVVCPVTHPIPPGTFTLGTQGATDPSQGSPTRTITVHSFAVSAEITRAQFAHFVQEANYRPSAGCLVARPSIFPTPVTLSPTASWLLPELPGPLQASEHPVTCVSWMDARAYAAWLSATSGAHYRLLSETEWEYLAHAGTTGPYYWPATTPSAYCDRANTYIGVPLARLPACLDTYPGTSPVGMLGLNPFQASDMLGNVEEWLEDCYAPTYDLIPANGDPYEIPVARPGQPPRNCRERVVRGGSWKDPITAIGIQVRAHAAIGERANFRGFRIALACDDLNLCFDQGGTPWPR